MWINSDKYKSDPISVEISYSQHKCYAMCHFQDFIKYLSNFQNGPYMLIIQNSNAPKLMAARGVWFTDRWTPQLPSN